jgi:phosphoenolpyruvate carboxykinase (GTP)
VSGARLKSIRAVTAQELFEQNGEVTPSGLDHPEAWGAVVPLVTEAFNWPHGVLLGSIMASETTAAAAGVVGNLRRDPFAMLPFCGYNMEDYFAHWLSVGASATDRSLLPRIFYVNWFRRDANGKLLWPGYGDNSRVLAWIFDRCAGKGGAIDTATGKIPDVDGLSIEGLGIDDTQLAELLAVDYPWREEVGLMAEHYATFGDQLPPVLRDQLLGPEKRLAIEPTAF